MRKNLLYMIAVCLCFGIVILPIIAQQFDQGAFAGLQWRMLGPFRGGRVLVPGGSSGDAGWKELVGASPESPAEFVPKLLSKDNGWLAAYFDSLSRISQNQQRHFTDAHRLQTFYAAFRASDSSNAARPAFRLAPGLLLLATRLQWDADGQPLVPGGLPVWKEVLKQKTDYKLVRDWGKRADHWTRPEQLVEAMFAFSRLETDLTWETIATRYETLFSRLI